MADLSKTSGEFKDADGGTCIRVDLWYLSWKYDAGCLCFAPWNGICIYT